jgi:hypothetical protein
MNDYYSEGETSPKMIDHQLRDYPTKTKTYRFLGNSNVKEFKER